MFEGILIGKDRDPLIRVRLCLSLSSLIKPISSLIDYYISLLSLTKAMLSLIDSYVSLLSLIKAILSLIDYYIS